MHKLATSTHSTALIIQHGIAPIKREIVATDNHGTRGRNMNVRVPGWKVPGEHSITESCKAYIREFTQIGIIHNESIGCITMPPESLNAVCNNRARKKGSSEGGLSEPGSAAEHKRMADSIMLLPLLNVRWHCKGREIVRGGSDTKRSLRQDAQMAFDLPQILNIRLGMLFGKGVDSFVELAFSGEG